ncbi:hypothetical protein SUDANB180_06484 [Streptomyces sp. enrichment culture]
MAVRTPLSGEFADRPASENKEHAWDTFFGT